MYIYIYIYIYIHTHMHIYIYIYTFLELVRGGDGGARGLRLLPGLRQALLEVVPVDEAVHGVLSRYLLVFTTVLFKVIIVFLLIVIIAIILIVIIAILLIVIIAVLLIVIIARIADLYCLLRPFMGSCRAPAPPPRGRANFHDNIYIYIYIERERDRDRDINDTTQNSVETYEFLAKEPVPCRHRPLLM